MSCRILYAAGPGNIIQAHNRWRAGEHDPTEVSITFSSQFADFCRDIDAAAYMVSYHGDKNLLHDGSFTLEHRPKPMPGATGIYYHVAEILYGLGLLATAFRFGANAAVFDSGTTHYFILSLFRLAGIKVVVVLHNTLWPAGFPPTGRVQRMIARLDALFFRYVPIGTIGVSPECIRQVEQLTGRSHLPLYQIRAQFRREHFQAIPPPPPFDQRPFRIMYIGRADRNKGVFDILEMARKIEDRVPGRVRWELCGSGQDLEELTRRQQEMGLAKLVIIHGWTPRKDQPDIYARCHLSIVPTRSSFSEGFAMTAAEAVLAGRPVITNPVVPGLEVLRPACLEARTNDVDSYVGAILKLVDDPNLYRTFCEACPGLRDQFYDRERGLSAVLRRVIGKALPKSNGVLLVKAD
jgi:glycogen(starch) synthase